MIERRGRRIWDRGYSKGAARGSCCSMLRPFGATVDHWDQKLHGDLQARREATSWAIYILFSHARKIPCDRKRSPQVKHPTSFCCWTVSTGCQRPYSNPQVAARSYSHSHERRRADPQMQTCIRLSEPETLSSMHPSLLSTRVVSRVSKRRRWVVLLRCFDQS